MAKRWLVVRVELVGGRGEVLDPAPGRVLVLPPGSTYDDFGRAVDLALGRWDLAHLRQFVLGDGTLVVDEESAAELAGSPFGQAIPRTAPLTKRVGRLPEGTRFRYVFDLGDEWTHVCTCEKYADPLDLLGVVPDVPTACWGWGSLPDQYGRRWDDDDGESPPPEGAASDLELPEPEVPVIDLRAFRVAVRAGDARGVVDAVTAVDIGTALQQVGAGLLSTFRAGAKGGRVSLAPLLASVLERLRERSWPGDLLLADEMLAVLRGEEPRGTAVPVDLDELTFSMSASSEEPGAYLDVTSGDVVAALATRVDLVGEEDAVDVEDQERFIFLVDDGSEAWRDMADFVEGVEDPSAHEELDEAVHGKGAFSRFRRALDRVEKVEEWRCFAEDRRWGRVREELADRGLRPV